MNVSEINQTRLEQAMVRGQPGQWFKAAAIYALAQAELSRRTASDGERVEANWLKIRAADGLQMGIWTASLLYERVSKYQSHESRGEEMSETKTPICDGLDFIAYNRDGEEIAPKCVDADLARRLEIMCAELATQLYRHVDMRCTCKDPKCLNDRQTLMDYTKLKGELKG